MQGNQERSEIFQIKSMSLLMLFVRCTVGLRYFQMVILIPTRENKHVNISTEIYRYGGFLSHGATPSPHPFRKSWDFPEQNPAIFRGTTPMWKPPFSGHSQGEDQPLGPSQITTGFFPAEFFLEKEQGIFT